MALKLTKALQAYDRVDVATIDCGSGWLYKIKSFSSVVKIFATEQARIKAAGGIRKKYAATASVQMTGAQPSIEIPDDPWLLGSYEADVDFFVENISVSWEGLKDDDGNDVPYSKEIAKEILLDNGEVGQQLFREMLANSLDAKLFLKTANAQAEEDGGN